jgi:hypothetical protein
LSAGGASSSVTASVSSLHAAAKPAAQEGAEGVRQQLRLLRMQHLQLRHLNARMETALQAKKEKVRVTNAARWFHWALFVIHLWHAHAVFMLHATPCRVVCLWSSQPVATLLPA